MTAVAGRCLALLLLLLCCCPWRPAATHVGSQPSTTTGSQPSTTTGSQLSKAVSRLSEVARLLSEVASRLNTPDVSQPSKATSQLSEVASLLGEAASQLSTTADSHPYTTTDSQLYKAISQFSEAASLLSNVVNHFNTPSASKPSKAASHLSTSITNHPSTHSTSQLSTPAASQLDTPATSQLSTPSTSQLSTAATSKLSTTRLNTTVNNKVSESQGSLQVTTSVGDENVEGPYFINRPLPMQTVVPLNAPLGTPVYTLLARDPDSDHDIHYFMVRDRSGGRFEVDELSGVVRTRGSEAFMPDLEYVLYVRAEDQRGLNVLGKYQSTKEERLSIVGGKRRPQFFKQRYEAKIFENHQKKSAVVSMKAKSFGNHTVQYTLKARGQGTDIFYIGPTTGIVKLAKELDYEDVRQPRIYSLLVTASEDSGSLSTSVELTVQVMDVNDNPPKFELAIYQTSVAEDIPIGTELIQVSATDADSGTNADVFSVSDDHFRVDDQGVIYTSRQLDADDNNGLYLFLVTVTDRGEPEKTGTATVRVYTTNTNDEKPRFTQQVYTPNVVENARPNEFVTTVVTSDKDGDRVQYAFANGEYISGPFMIERITGAIRVRTGATKLDRDKYVLNVTATDDGSCCDGGGHTIHTSTTVVVVFISDVNDNPPVFKECGNYHPAVKESTSNGSIVLAVKATDADFGYNGLVQYSIVQHSDQKTAKFAINENSGEIYTNKVFDREGDDGKFVSVTVRATDMGSPSQEGVCSVIVEILDVNDNPPIFGRKRYVSTMQRDTTVGSSILRVSASDQDCCSNGEVEYSLTVADSHNDLEYFAIQPDSGWITLKKPLGQLARHRLRVTATDRGRPRPLSSHADLQLDVVERDPTTTSASQHRNDHSPYFANRLYEAEVDENEDIQHIVITVVANDPDESSHLQYKLTWGNVYGAFGVRNSTGAVYVAAPLDYNTRSRYELRLVASDGLNENYTDVVIQVRDVNDNPPRFDKPIYRAEITEEDDRGLPRRLLQVEAEDNDVGRPADMVYFLSGQGIDDDHPENSTFTVDKNSGEIFVTRPLDRDMPNGQPLWRLTVFAQDEGGSGLVGYAEVQISLKDINDNKPYFPRLIYEGEVTENGLEEMMVMTMTAEDNDDPEEGSNARLFYSIEKNVVNESDGQAVFAIEESTGVIRTKVCCLDREKTSEYIIQVVARDGGGLQATGTAVIRVRDMNDTPPRFSQAVWNITVNETDSRDLPDMAILTVTVLDDDETNTFHYKVLENSGHGADKFVVVRNSDNTGSLRIVKPLDYENISDRNGFSFIVQVNDGGGNEGDSSHTAEARVNVKLRDINDNQPIFNQTNIEVSVAEDASVGTNLATFSAKDADQGGRSRVSYAIDRESDRKRLFNINGQGVVSIQCDLDREETPRHLINILAIDGGVPPKTVTATLTVIVEDVNDNAPTFLEDYRPVLMENTSPRVVAEVLASDADDARLGNGAPFLFRMDPAADDAIRHSFRVEQDFAGSNGEGMAVVSSLRAFDRENRKEYHVPIVIKDSGLPALSGTSTLTVRIGDVD